MKHKTKRTVLSVFLLVGFFLGCSKSEPDVKVEPAKGGKPFPKAGGRQTP